uniref:Putative transcriptional regulator n=1 Tax=termite gut metagenome TaxID=433724 RepID=S0DFZ8_9ZZZZ
MVVDDEPSALQHICSIIEKKCPAYQVVARAENGEQALALLPEALPDIVITDVRMPRMDGIGLVARLHREHPDIATVIVSGYQDFEYAKGAIQSGVSDYLLKPLKPSDLQELLERLEGKLNGVHHRHRTELMKAMCSQHRPGEDASLERYFPSRRYWAAIVRKNGLPRRFSRHTGFEIFSTEEEEAMIYGRDEMEALYLYPEELLEGRPFEAVARGLYEAELGPYLYVTAVVHREAFPIRVFPGVVKTLYHKLDESIVIGRNQCLADSDDGRQAEATEDERRQRELVERLIQSENSARLPAEAGKLFELWAEAGHNQIYVENQLRYLLQLMKQNHDFSSEYGNYTFLMDEALYYVNSMAELKLEMVALLKLLSAGIPAEASEAERLMGDILAYLHGHMEHPLAISDICGKFGVSQPTLSRWFRKYQNTSFNNYLTRMRMERARKILQQNPGVLVKDVAESVGYTDQFYFSRIFRSVVGVRPSDYADTYKKIDCE